jgi:cyclic-di-AMP phosphodiesterase PgpH
MTNGQSRDTIATGQEKRHTTRAQLLASKLPVLLFTATLLTGLALILVLPIPAGPPALRIGDVAKQSVRSPRRVAFVSQIKTRVAKDAAAAAVPDIYDYDPGIAQQQKQQMQILFTGIGNIRADTVSTPEQKRDRIQRLADGIVTLSTNKAIQAVDDFSWPTVVTESTRVLDEVMRDRVRQTDVPTIRAKLTSRFSQSLNKDQLAAASGVVSDLIKANDILNVADTTKQKRDAQDKIEPIRESIEKGEIIVREGNVVSEFDLERLEAVGLQQARTDWLDIAGALLLVLIVVIILQRYIAYVQPALLDGDRRLLVLVVGVLVLALAARVAAPEQVVEGVTWVYIIPFAVVPMLVGMFINLQMGMVVALLLGLLIGYIGGRSLDIAAMVALGGAAGALRTRQVDRLGAFLWAGVIVAMTDVAVVLAFFLPSSNRDTTAIVAACLLAVTSGGLSAALTAIIFAPLGNVLGTVTVLHLLELAHPSQPLFRRLLLEAPGTYHHSVISSTLAERAAEAIGADTLLARVGAYYHDIGKVVRPYMFIENQINGTNIHNTLDPQTSARAIMEHVADGMKLAHAYHLPARICNMIPEHHGTKMVSYFYQQARSQGIPASEADFRYPGPKPQTREAGILLLADGVEASVRSSRDHSQEAIERLVSENIRAQVDDGQLIECPLTLQDMERIREAFCGALQGVYHPRIEYPTFADSDEAPSEPGALPLAAAASPAAPVAPKGAG